MEEHKSAVKRGDEKNGIAVHAKKHQHQVDWEGAEVLYYRNTDTGREGCWRP